MVRYAQLFGDQPERPVPVAPLQPVQVTQAWPEPVIGYEALGCMVSQLTDHIDRLPQAEQAAHTFELAGSVQMVRLAGCSSVCPGRGGANTLCIVCWQGQLKKLMRNLVWITAGYGRTG